MMDVRALCLSLVVTVACGSAGRQPTVPSPAEATGTQTGVPTASSIAAAVPSAPRESDAAVPISGGNPTWGSRTALVTIVEFSDLECPFCARLEPTLSRIRDTYGPDDLRIVWLNDPLPFHPRARPAAEAAMGVFAMAGQQAFWRFQAAVFADQVSMGEESYVLWARGAGVRELSDFRAGLASHRWAGSVEADLDEARKLGVQGTPTCLINGVVVSGAQPFEAFKRSIDAELAKARAKVEAGTPRESVYAAMTRENWHESAPEPADDDDTDEKTVFKIPVGSSPVRGDANALVTIVEFGDYECTFCARVEPTLKAIRDKYGRKVRLVWKNEPLPFHPHAEAAAEAAIEVRSELGDAAFWTMHDKLFEAQKSLSLDTLARIAGEVGGKPDRVRRAVDDRSHARAILQDEDLADDFRANGTPHFFINGRRLVGAQPEEKFEAIIDEEIVRAQAAIAAGTPVASLYDVLVRGGVGAPEPARKEIPANLPANGPVRGNPLGRVTIHEWSDFQCPFCKSVESTLTQLMKDYGARVRLLWHDLPLPMHPDAPLAAQAGREALRQRGAAAFWQLHDSMFSDQAKLNQDSLDLYAKALGLDMPRWRDALDRGLHQAEIDAEKRTADAMGITGTPTFVIAPNGASRGYLVVGAQSYAKFRKLVERALGEPHTDEAPHARQRAEPNTDEAR
jgi:protein-disulfide isomerase